MAAATINTPAQERVATPVGYGQKRRMRLTCAFPTSDATCTIPVPFYKVTSVIPTPAAAPNTDETLYWGDTLTNDSFNPLASAGTGVITIGRTGTKTSALPFCVDIEGY